MNKDIKVEDNKQKTKDACPAETEADSELMPKITTSRPAAILLCVSSEAAFAMGVGLSVGEVEQPSPSNRLYAALIKEADW